MKYTEASRLDDVSRATDMDGEIDPPIELVVDTYVKDAQWKQAQADIQDWIRTETSALQTLK